MKNRKLAELNFRKLLHYEGEPNVRASQAAPIPCTGFCVSCEQNGILDSGDQRLDKLSHGADTNDFERAIGKLPAGGLDVPVAFLLESPGGEYDLGSPISYKGITKRPPVNHYYWVPTIPEWPADPSKVDPGSYGPYFAYIIATHKLSNAYFTNVIKCSLAPREGYKFIRYFGTAVPEERETKILANCFNLFLNEEMMIVNPKIVFCFGGKAAKMASDAGLNSLLPAARFVTLLHPAALNYGKITVGQLIERNDQSIQDALTERNEG